MSETPTNSSLRTSPASFGKIMAWSMWDWGTQPFATVITTFVFSVYITSSYFGSGNGPSLALSVAMGVAGLFIALLAPVLGQGSDRSGKRMFNLRWQTWLLAAISAALYFVAPEPAFLWLGLGLLGVGNVVAEIANVNYYASIDQVATKETAGRVSGFGWGMGYLGGISILLLIVALRGDDFTPDDVRISMLICGAWTLIFTIPIFLTLKDKPVADPPPKRSILEAYQDLWKSLKDLFRESRGTVWFLVASALFRDGLAGVFTFGAVLASVSFGFEAGEVITFGIAANVIAGLATIAFGQLDDRIGPKRVIIISLTCLVALSMIIFIFSSQGKIIFWVCGLALTMFVGPAQSASRSFLARQIPEGKSGEVFGLYATTGRAVSFLSPAAFFVSVSLAQLITGSDNTQLYGILGIAAILLVGLLVLLRIPDPARNTAD